MKAAVEKEGSCLDSKNQDRRCIRAWSVVVQDETGKTKSVATVRWYKGLSRTSTTVYCDFLGPYCDAARRFLSASGKAGGGGYDKYSASLDDAIRNAGLALDDDIAGCGDRACEAAIAAVCELSGSHDLAIIHTL